MKKISNFVINIKTFAGMIFIGEIILFMIAKSILGVYDISFITIISLALLALCISVLRHIFESDFINERMKRWLVVASQYVLVVTTIFDFNFVFNYFIVSQIQYLYLFLFITACYLGGVLGFYIISKLEVDLLNIKLNRYHSK